MIIPKTLSYTRDHEWIRIINNLAVVGITEYAQSELGDIIFIELPKVGDKFQVGDPVGTIEAVKTVADIYAPINGEISEINNKLEEQPDFINKDPYEKGWIIKLSNIDLDINNLLTSSDYKELIK